MDNALGLGLLHMGARHYSPSLGRFLQPDPSALEANLYAYAANSPVTKVDPSGRGALAVPIALCLASIWCIAAVGVGAFGLLRMILAGRTTVRIDLNLGQAATLRQNYLTGKAFEAASIRNLKRDWPAVKAPTYFKTPYGGRFLDACVWRSSAALGRDMFSNRPHPMFCIEFKSSGGAAFRYLGSTSEVSQYAKDRWIETNLGVPIELIWVP